MSRLGTLTEVSPKGPDEFESVWGVTVGGIDVDAFEASWSATNFGVGLRASSSISKIDAGAVAFGGVVEVVDVLGGERSKSKIEVWLPGERLAKDSIGSFSLPFFS